MLPPSQPCEWWLAWKCGRCLLFATREALPAPRFEFHPSLTLSPLTPLRCAWRGRCLLAKHTLQFSNMAASDMRARPARPTLHDRLGILSSSPSFPDLQDLIATKTKPQTHTLRSGSAAAPIPENASSAFTTASDFLRIARATGDDFVDVIDEPDPPAAKKTPAKRVRKSVKRPLASKEAKEMKTSRPGKASKRVAKEVIVLSSDGVDSPKATRHVEPITAETGPVCTDAMGTQSKEGTPLKARPWKKFKPRTSPEQEETEAGMASTQPSAKPTSKPTSQKSKRKPDTVSRHFSTENEAEPVETGKSNAKEKRPRASTPEPMNLEPAVQRRADWTPAKPDTLIVPPSPDPFDMQEASPSGRADEKSSDAIDLFKNLSDKYGHKVAGAGGAGASKQQQTTQILGKRKVIELVSVNLSSNSTEANRKPSPVKVKAPKKKPRTITDLATAAYAPKITEEDGGRDDSFLEYFSVEDPEDNIPRGAAAKGKRKASNVTKSKKKAAPKKPVLLSPQSAMRQSAAQDFVFGTASQLAREKSPTFLRDLHAAMKASTIAEEEDPLAGPSIKDPLQSKVRGKGLWSVSARDGEGELVDIEIIDMMNSPALPQDDAILDPWTQLPPEAGGAQNETADSSVIEIDSRPAAPNQRTTSQPSVPKSHSFMTQKLTLNAAAAMSPTSPDESFPLITQLLEDEMPPPSNQQQTQEEVSGSPSKATVPAQKPCPNYETFTDVKLAKEISKFGFKAVKTRTGMIALLDQCWKRKSQAAVTGASFSTSSVLASPKRKQAEGPNDFLTASPSAKKQRGKTKKAADVGTAVAERPTRPRAPNVPVTEGVTSSPKKKVGRPRKDATAAAKAASSMPPPPKPQTAPSTPKHKKAATQAELVVDDLDLDSEIEVCESTPEQLFSPAGANADMTIGEDTEISLNLSPTAQQSTLFSHITKAVTSAPRTVDPENPSWHEKMLMYDPVILEELTAWLNSGELTRLGYDDEVSPHDVKKWCELRSICCLWKGNWHGKERKRF